MNIQTIIKILTDAGIEENEAKKEVKMLLEHFSNYTELDRMRGKILPESEWERIKEKAEYRAKTRTPVQYIIGESYFMGEFFKVTPAALIPRDETELLVREAITIIKENNFKEILDIGTGSGCIACTIAKQTEAVVLGVDISSDALRIALDNVTKLGINNRAVFRKSNLFEKVREDERFDMIISNPPYIPIGTPVEPEVLHEPAEALFSEENGLQFYRRIIEDAPRYLKPRGYLMFELGVGESESVALMMEKSFQGIHIMQDLAGIDRVIYGYLK